MKTRLGRLLEFGVILTVIIPLAYLLVVFRPNATKSPSGDGIGSTVSQGATPPPDASLDPKPPQPGECFTYGTTFDQPLPTIRNQSTFASAVLIGDVTKVGDGQWVGGKEPPDDDKTGTSVYRDVTVQVSTVAKGKVGPETTFRIPGGMVGCDRYLVVGFPDVKPGDRFAYFVQGNGKAAALSELTAFEVWGVTEAGIVETAADGELPIADFVRDVKAATP